MILLVAGLFLWTVVHLLPSIGVAVKTSLIKRIGKGGYAALFSALIVTSLALIVFGWRSGTPTFLYALPAVVKPISLFLIALAFILLGAANYKTRIKRVVRHPQLTGVIIWAGAHLLLNGDSRSVTLFGWLAIWAVAEIVLINKRDGQTDKPEAPSWSREVLGALVSLVVFTLVIFAHPYIAGLPVR